MTLVRSTVASVLFRPLLLFVSLLLVPLLVVPLLLVAGCSDDGGTRTGITATLENIWPNEDGRSWTYAGLARGGWEDDLRDSAYVFPDSASVPPAPDFLDIIPLIDNPPLPDAFGTRETEYGLTFDGQTTTQSGVTAQNLVEELDSPASAPGAHARFLALLAAARPDLRPRLRALGAPVARFSTLADTFEFVPPGPLLIHGGAWEKTEEWIGTYGDRDTLLAWQFLRDDLTPGSSFTFPLVPSIANDASLNVLVRRLVTVKTPVGTFENALDVVYVASFGVARYGTVFQPDFTGYSRWVAYGNVIYVPTVGPVFTYEKPLAPVGEDGVGLGVGDFTYELTGVQAGGS
jgi:hypothetical protein